MNDLSNTAKIRKKKRIMDRIRIGKDITLCGVLTVNGIAVDLAGLDLEAVATNKSGMTEYPCEITVSGNAFTVTLRGHRKDGPELALGKYVISIWQNRGSDRQTVWDVLAFQLVQWTFKENDDDDGLDVQKVDLGVIEVTDKAVAEAHEAAMEAHEAASRANEAADRLDGYGIEGILGDIEDLKVAVNTPIFEESFSIGGIIYIDGDMTGGKLYPRNASYDQENRTIRIK